MYRKINRFVLFLNRQSHLKKRIMRIFIDGMVILLSYYLSYSVRFEWNIPPNYMKLFFISAPALLVVSLFLFVSLGAYSEYWVYWSVRDLRRLTIVHTSSVLMLFLLDGVMRIYTIPRSIFVIYWVFTILLLGAIRMVSRTILEIQGITSGRNKRILIVGAGRSGESLIRQILADPKLQYEVIGLIDDDPNKHNRSIHGVRVKGNRSDIPKIVNDERIDEIIIAVPSAKSTEMQNIVELCTQSGASFRTVPGNREVVDGKITFNRVRKVRIGDLLGREQSDMDFNRIRALIENKTILVTGAAGSIGSELCRQIQRFKPFKLLAVDRDENGLFYLQHELQSFCPIDGIVMNVTNQKKVDALLKRHTPHVILHAAAYKHVPCMEQFPDEAVMNNLGSTMVMTNAAIDNRIKKFIQISTDKAVFPTSMMGVTKRLCELYVHHMSQKHEIDYSSVRFGNVIGSKGSVFTIFEKQIANGGPVTITDIQMERYFMSIDEACKLVLEAAAIGEKGQNFVLDMGEPIKIVDLARHMIALAGFVPEDEIPIEVTGVRPGEKTQELLWYPYEKPEKTANPKILVSQSEFTNTENFIKKIDDIIRLAEELNMDGLVPAIREVVPEYDPMGLGSYL